MGAVVLDVFSLRVLGGWSSVLAGSAANVTRGTPREVGAGVSSATDTGSGAGADG